MIPKNSIPWIISVLSIFIISLAILAPIQSTNTSMRKKIEAISSNIQTLYQTDIPPNQMTLQHVEKKNQTFQSKIAYLEKTMSLALEEKYSASVFDFRSQWDNNFRQIQKQANKTGVVIAEGFGWNKPLPDGIPEHYWVHMNIANHVVQALLELAEVQQGLVSLVKIDFPKLESTWNKEPFLQEYQIQITWESTYMFAIRALHNLAAMPEKKNERPFLALRDVTLSLDKASSTVQVVVICSGIKIFPEGSIDRKVSNKNENPKTQVVPLWERY